MTYEKSSEVELSEHVLLRANNIALESHTLLFDELRYLRDPIPEDKFVSQGSILICTASGSQPHLGKVAYISTNLRMGFGGFMGLITPNSEINGKFLFYTLIAPNFKSHLESISSGVNINNLKFSDIGDFSIWLPSLPEQQRIVAILDQAFENIAKAKANAERNLTNAEELADSYREEELSGRSVEWIYCQVADICDIKHGFAFESEYFTNSGDYILLTPGNFFERGGYRDRGNKQKYYSGPIPDGFVLSSGDLLLAMTEQAAGLLGSPAIVPVQGRFLHNQRLGKVVPKHPELWHTGFFYHVFNSRRVRSNIHSSATGVKVRHSSPSKISAVKVSFPDSAATQGAIASRIDKVYQEAQNLRSTYDRRISNLEALSTSLLQQAFSGGL